MNSQLIEALAQIINTLSPEEKIVLEKKITSQSLDSVSFESNQMRPSGLCEGEFIVPDDFDDPLPEEILQSFEGS